MSEKRLPIISRIFFSFLGLFLILIVSYKNFEPFGITLHYSTSDKKENISKLNPINRIEKVIEEGREVTKQIEDLIYFSASHPSRIESGTVKIKFKNPNSDRDIYIGFQDQEIWHYEKKLIDAPLLNSIDWPRIGTDPVLWQKNKKYESVAGFLDNPPEDAIIGFYNYDKQALLKKSKLENYSPKKETTIFSIPLRGKHTFYTYVENEMFKMNIFLQDLNRDEGPDVTTVRIYKENEMVFERIIEDDGIEEASGKVGELRVSEIQNPGPELPEPGVYKIVIDSPNDTIIKKIETNLHKIVLQGPINLPPVDGSTTLYSNAKTILAKVPNNDGLQIITVGNESLSIDKAKTAFSLNPINPRFMINIPKNNIVINGQYGYFSQNEENFFEPSFYSLLPINEKEDLDVADYIITSYNPSKKEGDWQIAETEFDLEKAWSKRGKLSWIIQVPGLKENGQNIIIDSISVDLYKKPIIKWK